jgi:hypothetical protein
MIALGIVQIGLEDQTTEVRPKLSSQNGEGAIAMRMRGQPLERFIYFVVSRDFAVLFLVWIIFYFVIALLFAYLYLSGSGWLKWSSGGTAIVHYPDALHFSLSSQSTVGYGDIVPASWGRLIAHSQSFVGLMLNGLALGVMASKIINMAPTVEFPDFAIYEPKFHLFRFRFFSISSHHISDTSYSLTLRIPVSGTEILDTASYRVDLPQNMDDIFRPLRVMAITTASNGGKPLTLPSTHHVIPTLTPGHLCSQNPNSAYGPSIDVTVSGIISGTNGHFAVTKTYYVEQIRCGIPANIDNNRIEKYSARRKRKLLGKELVEFSDSTSDTCKSCPFFYVCPLEPANSVRKSVGCSGWAATDRLQALIATAAMDEATRSAWCRERGLYPAELDGWKREAIAGLGEPSTASAVEVPPDRPGGERETAA